MLACLLPHALNLGRLSTLNPHTDACPPAPESSPKQPTHGREALTESPGPGPQGKHGVIQACVPHRVIKATHSLTGPPSSALGSYLSILSRKSGIPLPLLQKLHAVFVF